jgi:hypothetical protein
MRKQRASLLVKTKNVPNASANKREKSKNEEYMYGEKRKASIK